MTNNSPPPEQYYERHHLIGFRNGLRYLSRGDWQGHYQKPFGLFAVKLRAGDSHKYRILDSARAGPLWLKRQRIASLVVDAIKHCEERQKFYRVLAFVVMPNHVHLLIGSLTVPLAHITKVLKGYTARHANEILGRSGRTFWQNESFDHWVRSPDELSRIVRYVENNPVTARLVSRPEDWVWSSAHGQTLAAHVAAQKRTDKNVCPTV